MVELWGRVPARQRASIVPATSDVIDLTPTSPRTEAPPPAPAPTPVGPEHGDAPRLATIGLVGLRLAIGFEFLWAFLDKTFGLGYSTAHAKAWIHGGSPTSGFLSHADAGPLHGMFHSMAGVAFVDWLFMLGLLGVGLALVLGVAIRPAALFGSVMLAFMYVAVWTPAKVAAGQPTASTNPIIDDHIVSILGLIAVAALITRSAGYLGRRWASLRAIQTRPWLR
jgi:thiosulfate dehydrogenase [quinone] large subunit